MAQNQRSASLMFVNLNSTATRDTRHETLRQDRSSTRDHGPVPRRHLGPGTAGSNNPGTVTPQPDPLTEKGPIPYFSHGISVDQSLWGARCRSR